MTGWGQEGPLATTAGHDIDYLALTGALHGIGRAGERPVPPMNLLGDFGGGGMMLALGVVAALYAVRAGGPGQVVDAAIVDGVSVLATQIHALRRFGMWQDARGVNLLDGGAPVLRHVRVRRRAAPRRRRAGAAVLRRTGPAHRLPARRRRGRRPHRPGELARAARGVGAGCSAPGPATSGRSCWPASDACVTPVLDWREAPEHPHLAARGVFVEHDGVTQPAPAPRFSGTPTSVRRPPPQPGEHTDELLAEAGFDADRIAALRAAGAIG